ncbi:MAG: LPS export ABC transporter periplasmic protein LptC [Armatimonadetes bacterium]|nr:LPS export ABC transporter periplasmic protein LptC [Armatimonadota bacterium]MDW8154917.1 LPS export ABC transporter periplasmic protein LptC [Armatimonadota bacterium]
MRTLLIVGITAGLVAGFAWAMRTEPVPEVPATPAPPVALRAEETRVVVRHRGAPQVDLRAREAEVTPDQQRATLKDVARATVFREGKEFLRVRARRIVFNRSTQNFVATGEVEITSPDGDWLRAPEVVYHNDRALLVFPKGVEFQLGRNHARARILRYHVQRDVVEMEGEVDVQLDIRSLPSPGPEGGR